MGGVSTQELEEAVAEIVPSLKGDSVKGQSGLLATIGGCREYTGAPFFASMTCLKVGADLSHTFCTEGAATVIKSYSPELIVHPYLPDSHDLRIDTEREPEKAAAAVKEAIGAMNHWMPRFNCVVIGPGLGRDPLVHDTVKQTIRDLRARNQFFLVDADGLYITTKDPDLIKGYRNVVLTPNKNEYQRLADQLGIEVDSPDSQKKITAALGGPTIIRKGPRDVVMDPDGEVIEGTDVGCPRRSGGQGDVMSGCVATFMAWTVSWMERTGKGKDYRFCDGRVAPLSLAAYGGTLVARHAAANAFASQKRSMVAEDLIDQVGYVVDQLFDEL